MSDLPSIAAILLAGGSGTRLGAPMPKQYLTIAGKPVLRWAAEGLAGVTMLQPVGDADAIAAALDGIAHLPPVPGGDTRQDSVRAGLEALAPHAPEIVLVHDGARPIIPPGTIQTLVDALATHDGAIPALKLADTVKLERDGIIDRTVPREHLYRAQTPQAFRFATLLERHRAGARGATDDAGLIEDSRRVALVPGHEDNIKLTYQEDLVRLERILAPPMLPRVGTGYDVHLLAEGRKLILCGVDVPHEKGLAGHSDADVGIHALCDAIYGALAEGDIGRWFPPTDMKHKDQDSADFLRHAAARVAARGGSIANVDVTLICERPKITPHAPAMIARLAELLGIGAERVSVKATTTERLGFTGRMEGIAAQAVAMVIIPA
jgi:2-C-methyl-D-erythritol 4-phosphate cytidylyltransferase/2-C-methyl-D-erythritol 2,4-cyclodiphosphate synthase